MCSFYRATRECWLGITSLARSQNHEQVARPSRVPVLCVGYPGKPSVDLDHLLRIMTESDRRPAAKIRPARSSHTQAGPPL